MQKILVLYSHKSMRIYFLFPLILLLTSCASPSIKNKVNIGSKIAVIGLLPNEINVQKTGISRLGNSKFKVAVPEWDVNSYVEMSITESLNPFYSIAVEISRNKLRSFIEGSKSKSFELVSNDDAISLLKNYGIEFLITIEASHSYNPFVESHQGIEGIGFHQKSLFGSRGPMAYYVALDISLYEIDTGDRLAINSGGFVKMGDRVERAGLTHIDVKNIWLDQPSDVTKEIIDAYWPKTEKMIDRVVRRSINKMKLVNDPSFDEYIKRK